MIDIIRVFINGLSLGGVYALIALGYTMVYGIAKMLNFAHGDIIMVGGYTIVVCLNTLGFHPLLCVLGAVVVCVAVGVVMEKLAYKPLRGSSPLFVLITAIGVSYLLQSLAQIIFGSGGSMVVLADWGTVSLGGLVINVYTLVTLVVAIVLMVALTLFINKTRTGKAMLAVSEDRDAALLMGIDVNKIISVTFAVGAALAAIAGAFYILETRSVSPTLGSLPGIKAFTAAVIGGIGSVSGAMFGGLLLGVIECACNAVPGLSNYTVAIEFGLLIVILLVKPTGLLGKKKSEKV